MHQVFSLESDPPTRGAAAAQARVFERVAPRDQLRVLALRIAEAHRYELPGEELGIDRVLDSVVHKPGLHLEVECGMPHRLRPFGRWVHGSVAKEKGDPHGFAQGLLLSRAQGARVLQGLEDSLVPGLRGRLGLRACKTTDA